MTSLKSDDKSCEQVYKPSSVFDGHLSWRIVAETLLRTLPEAGRAAL